MLIVSAPSCTACSEDKEIEVATPDFEFQDHGSIGVLTPKTEAATAWLDEQVEGAQVWARGIAIDSRHVGAILAGIADAGLEVA